MGVTIKDLSSYNSINSINFGETVVFIKFGAEWCEPCKNLENEINKLDKFILYGIDIDNDEFKDFMDENNIFSFELMAVPKPKDNCHPSLVMSAKTAGDNVAAITAVISVFFILDHSCF